MADRYNEGKALDAVLRFIEARDSALRKNDGWSPDDPKNQDPDPLRRVDYVCMVGQTLYAFEHTSIQPFENQIKVSVDNEALFKPIVEWFDHRSDQESWVLITPIDASAGLTENDVPRVRDALIKWIDANVGRIPVAPLYGRHHDPLLGESTAGIPFGFSLRRTSLEGPYLNPLRGRFRWIVVAPSNLEQLRVTRLKRASEDKYPKLAKWKQDPGARTVLVLEEDDLWLTNHLLVADAMDQAEATAPDTPDEVFLVSTCIEQTWWVVCLRGPGLVAGEPMPNSEFNPKELTKLTSR